jgi:hypothetical protein
MMLQKSINVRQSDQRCAPIRHQKKDVLRAVWSLELELVSAEQDIIETPGLGSEGSRVAHLSLLDQEGEVDGAHASVTSSPRLARAGVGSMAVRAQALAVDECMADNVDGLVAGKAEKLGDDGSGGDLDEDDVVETDAVERVLEREHSLDLVGLDHALEHVSDCQRSTAVGNVGSGDPVCDSENGAQVVRRVAPL